jgi:antitoxin MazE
MDEFMKTQIVSIGNSRGILIPKLMLKQTGLADEVDISVEDDALVIRHLKKPRTGWATAFREMAQRGDDNMLDVAATM